MYIILDTLHTTENNNIGYYVMEYKNFIARTTSFLQAKKFRTSKQAERIVAKYYNNDKHYKIMKVLRVANNAFYTATNYKNN